MRNDGLNPIIVQHPISRIYENLEFTLASGITNYDVKDNVSGAFLTCQTFTTINIRTDQTITIRLNSTGNNAITIVANKPFELDNLVEIINIFITNSSGSTANIKIFGVRKDR